MTIRTAALAALGLALLAAGPLGAEGEGPRSAIDWLRRPAPEAAPPAAPGAETPEGAPGGLEVFEIAAPGIDSAGTLSEAESGVPADFWRGVPALRARALLTRVRGDGALAAARLHRRILLARARAPADSAEGAFLRLRVERLLHAGALEDARALLAAAGAWGPAFTEYALTIGQLTAEDRAPCTAALAEDAPRIAPESRAYCLIRLGRDEEARAAIEALRGGADPMILALLEAQLDPDLARTVEGPENVSALSPLALALIDGVGAPRPSNFAAAPAAYFWADLTEAAPHRDRLLAAERLARAGALPADRLAELYGRLRSAESGGIWGRVEAWRRMEAAEPGDRAARIAEMDRLAAEAGLRAALAPALHERARRAEPEGGPMRRRFAEIALLAGDPAAAIALSGADAPERLRALIALASGEAGEFPDTAARARRGEADAQRLAAALAALGGGGEGEGGEDEAHAQPETRADAAAPAERALAALAALDAGEEIAPDAFGEALAGLAAAGFEDDARAIAVEIVLAGRAG